MKSSKLRRCRYRVLLFLVLVLLVSAGITQSPHSDPSAGGPPIRDPQAIAAVQQTLAVLGGQSGCLSLRTAVIRGSEQVDGEQAVSSFLWEDDLSGKIPEFRKEIHSGGSVHVLVSGHGTAAHQRDGKQKQLAPQVAWAVPPLYLPGVVLARQLANGQYSFQLMNDNSGLVHIRTSWDLNSVTSLITPQDWYFDPTTRLPIRVQYRLPNTENPGHVTPASMDFSDFRNISGIAVPFKIVAHGADQRTRTFILIDVQTNGSIDATHFEISGGQQ